MAEITLYDLPILREGRYACFSFNPWKARMILNYKELPYKTQFEEYPDLEPALKALGVPPNPQGSWADYTSPTIRLPDGTFIADSAIIAPKLESLYPKPSLHLDAGIHNEILEAVDAAVMAVVPNALVQLLKILPERSATFFAEDRKKRFGISLEELAKAKGGAAGWETARAPGGPLDKLRDVLTKHRRDEGPFALGSQVSYGDFIAASLFECLERTDIDSYHQLMSFDDQFKTLHNKCRPWLQRDD